MMGFDKKLVYIWKIPAQFTRFLVIKIQSATKTRRNDSFKRRVQHIISPREWISSLLSVPVREFPHGWGMCIFFYHNSMVLLVSCLYKNPNRIQFYCCNIAWCFIAGEGRGRSVSRIYSKVILRTFYLFRRNLDQLM